MKRHVVQDLLDAAGLQRHSWTAAPPARPAGIINRHLVVTLDSGACYVAREYSWPFGEEPDMDRQGAERWVLEVLGSRGVPVPGVVASIPGAVLLSRVPGTLLAHAVLDGAPDVDEAWRVAGAALRGTHDIAFEDAGSVVGGGAVKPFDEGSWAAWSIANARHHAERMAREEPDAPADVDAIAGLFELARPLLEATLVRLLHNDASPWNVLVEHTSRGWRCTGWIDWEFAWAADPDWDLARNTHARFEDIGPTPRSFFEGYGREPDPRLYALYEMSFYLWHANDDRDRPFDWECRRAAKRYVSELPDHVERVRKLIER